jgi:hypothetical protein
MSQFLESVILSLPKDQPPPSFAFHRKKPVSYFLIFLILAAGGGGYYEYSIHDQALTKLKKQGSELDTAVAGLQTNVKSLTADQDSLTKKLATVKATAGDLAKTFADAKSAATDAQTAQAQAKTAADSAKDLQTKAESDLQAALHPPATNKLGTIATSNGKSYDNCVVKEVQPDGLLVSTSAGFVTILYPFLPGPLQRQFGYDPDKSLELTAAQVQDQERIRIAGGSN